MVRRSQTPVAPFLILASGLVLAPLACSSSETGTGTSAGSGGAPAACTPDLASIQEKIFLPSCAQSGCHGANSPAAGLDLSRTDIDKALINVPAGTCDGTLVVPGSPASSYLFDKVSSAKPKCGAKMPMGGALSAEQISCIQQWISTLEPTAGTGGAGGAGGGSGCETCGGTSCVDLTSDPANCGACGKSCATGSSCSNGQCACPGGGVDCNGACVDTTSDAKNCGMCGKACAMSEFCSGGNCVVSCGPLTVCGTACVDLNTSPSNCGMCGKACASGASCVSGKCECPQGSSACNGVCIDTTSDPQNCGACGKVCSLGQTCTNSACTCGSASVSFSGAVQPIFTASCALAGCHKGLVPQAGLDLSSGKAYAELVNVTAGQCMDGRKRVTPGQPDQSYLIDKMVGMNLCFGTKMPKLGGVNSNEITTVANWICAGAPNN